jgi:CheY-like chemotaxis protein
MLTGSDDITVAFDNGASDFIRKPFDKPEIIARVKSSLAVINSKIELKQRTIEIEIQRDKLKMQKEILTKQKKELSECIALVEKTQNLITPPLELIRKTIPQYFILEMPKENLKKHFFWFYAKHNHFIFSVGSINRQGLSVSILNTLCVNILNEIASHTDPMHLVPSKMIDVIKEQIQPMYDNNPDSLNLIIGSLSIVDKTIQYSGVNLPFYVLKNNKITELKVEKFKNGIFSIEKQSVNHKIQLATDDTIYLINNGFNDNLGTDYISDEMSKLFVEIHKKPLDKQKRQLEKTFQAWREELRQIDDIFILGFKVPL